MAFIKNFVIPLFSGVIFSGILLFFVVGIYFLFKKFFDRRFFSFKMWFKYKFLKVPYDETMVEWALKMIDKETEPLDLMKSFYSTNKFKLGQFQEAEYLLKQIINSKVRKGGLN